MRLGHTLCEDAGVLGVEEEINALQSHIVVGAVPLTGVPLSLFVVAVNEHWPPGSQAIFVSVETFTWDRNEGAVRLLTIRDPFFRLTTVVLGVIEVLKGQPVFLILLRLRIVDALQ